MIAIQKVLGGDYWHSRLRLDWVTVPPLVDNQLVKNLDNPEYMELLLNGKSNLIIGILIYFFLDFK